METRDFVDLKDVFTTVPYGKDRNIIRNFNFMNKEQPASVGRLALELGFEVRHQRLPNHVSAYLEPDTWSDKGFEIVVNDGHSVLRQRFSALHEMAHYYLHSPTSDPLTTPKHRTAMNVGFEQVYFGDEVVEELEANRWADAVIFGDRALEGAVGRLGLDLVRLKAHFGFSEQVLTKALQKRAII